MQKIISVAFVKYHLTNKNKQAKIGRHKNRRAILFLLRVCVIAFLIVYLILQ